MPRLIHGFLILLLCFSISWAFDDPFTMDENALFGDEEASIVEAADTQPLKSDLYADTRSTNFSGQFQFQGNYALHRDWLAGNSGFSNNQLLVYTQGDLFLDIRMQKGVKAFIDMGLVQSARSVSGSALNSALSVKELFMDIPFGQGLYLRSGKQFIQWGRAYFWNPTDLLNSQSRDFLNLNAIREGTNGIRFMLSQSVKNTSFLFLQTEQAQNLDDFALAAKNDWVLGSTEIGLSLWLKHQKEAVLGLDWSSRCGNWDVKGEATLANGLNTPRLILINGIPATENVTNEPILKVAANFGRSFNWERANRILVSYEFFWNGAGYEQNLFKNSLATAALIGWNLYRANYHARWYHALFMSINEFPDRKSTTSFNFLQNLVDSSGILSIGVTRQIVDGFTASGSTIIYFGPRQSEFLLYGYGAQLQLSGTLSF